MDRAGRLHGLDDKRAALADAMNRGSPSRVCIGAFHQAGRRATSAARRPLPRGGKIIIFGAGPAAFLHHGHRGGAARKRGGSAIILKATKWMASPPTR
jgi:hypothetical protein